MLPREVVHPLRRFCEQADTPISLGVYLRLKYEAYDELAVMAVNPSDYLSPYSYFIDNQAVAWLQKYEPLPTTFDRKAKAREATLQAEFQCKLTNDRLAIFLHNGPFESIDDIRILEFIQKVRKIIKKILRSCPDPEFKFGPGVTLSDRGTDVTVLHKCCSTPTLTSSAVWLLPFWGRTQWGRNPSCKDLEIRDVSRFTSVPKNAKTHRGIEIQSSINVAAQLGFGKLIRSRLCRAGIDLQHNQEFHRSLARKGSIDGSLATIDLKSASDTICKNLVKLLLPEDWFWALDSIRHKRIEIDGKTFLLERFSSMGNGYTFELETLIFYAICKVASGYSFVSVYGDDIIIQNEKFEDVVAALRYFGFTINSLKSFNNGEFRESCGGDFFRGWDVRPFQLKEEPNDPARLISYCNGVRRSAHRFFDGHFDLSPFHRSWLFLTDCIPKHIRECRGPERLGDIVLHDEPSRWRSRTRHSITQYRCYRPVRFGGIGWERFCGTTQLAAAVYGVSLSPVGSTGSTMGLTYRNSVLGYSIGWTA